jgi:hypothetical protein
MTEPRRRKTFYLTLWLPLLYALGGFCFFLAWQSYPKGYRLPDYDISDLGHPRLNPHGWWYWCLGLGIASIMIYPPIAYASRRMRTLADEQNPGTRHLVKWGSLCLRASCLGLLGLALTPQGPTLLDAMHQTAGVFAFGGMYVTLLGFWGVPLFRLRTIGTARLTVLVVSSWWAVIGFLATQGYRFFALGELGHSAHEKHESLLLRFSFWEWMLLVGVTSAFYLLIALLPGDSQSRNGNSDNI